MGDPNPELVASARDAVMRNPDLELVASARLFANPPTQRKTVLLLYDSNSLPVPSLAGFVTHLGHVLVMPAAPGAGLPRRQNNTYRYEADQPFKCPDVAEWTRIVDFANERAGQRRIDVVIVLAPPQATAEQLPNVSIEDQTIRSLEVVLNSWSGASRNLITEVSRSSPCEAWTRCFDRYELAMEQRHERNPLNRYILDALNGVVGLGWMDVDGTFARRDFVSNMQELHEHMLQTLPAPELLAAAPALTNLQRRFTALRRCSPDPAASPRLFGMFDRLFLRFKC